MVRKPVYWKKIRGVKELKEIEGGPYPTTKIEETRSIRATYPTREMLEKAGWKRNMTKEEFIEAKEKLLTIMHRIQQDVDPQIFHKLRLSEDRLLDEWLRHEEEKMKNNPKKPRKPRRKAPDEIWH